MSNDNRGCNVKLQIPNTNMYLHVGDVVKLGRFSDIEWQVCHGWFSFGGNRPWCGWYLRSLVNDTSYYEKPIQLTDLEDVYVIHHCNERRCS